MQKPLGVLLSVCAMAVALTACGGGKSSSSTTTTANTAASPAASPSAAAMKSKGTMASATKGNGATIYNANCASCHQMNGKGSAGSFPPLAGNSTVTGPADKVIHIVKNGLTGSIKVNGTTYNGMMPAWKSSLSNADIAAVITYIRSSWGNHASAVTEKQVLATK
jgi:mono/diheme cytochrome c family protein